MNNNSNTTTASNAFTPSHHPSTIVTPFASHFDHDDDECSELMPRCLPLPHPQEEPAALSAVSNVPQQPPMMTTQCNDDHELNRPHDKQAPDDAGRPIENDNSNGNGNGNAPEHSNLHARQLELYRENQQLRTILRDLGCSSLIPPSTSHYDDESTHSSQLSQSFVQNLNANRKQQQQAQHHDTHYVSMNDVNLSTIPSHIPMTRSSSRRQQQQYTDDQSQLIHELNMEREQLHQMCHLQTEAFTQAQTELHSITLQNDAMTHENSRLHSEIHMLRERVQEEQHRCDALQNEVRALHTAKNELWKDLNGGMEERTELERDFRRVEREAGALRQDLQLKMEENQQLVANLKQLEEDLQRRVVQIAALEGEKDECFVELRNVKKALEKMESEKNRLDQDLHCSRMNSELNSQKTLEIQQFAAKSHDDAVAYQNLVVELEGERDSIQMMLNEERAKVTALEDALYSSKACENSASEQIRILVKEKAQVVTKLNEANARLGSASSNGNTRRTPESVTKRADSILKQTKSFFQDGATTSADPASAPVRTTPASTGPPNSNRWLAVPMTRNRYASTPSQSMFAGRTPSKDSKRLSIEEKQKAVELSLRELEIASPSSDNIVGGQQLRQDSINCNSNNSKHMDLEVASKGKENKCPRSNVMMRDDDVGKEYTGTSIDENSISLLDPLPMDQPRSPPSTKSECASNSLLDFLSQDDASTLI